MVFPDTDRLPVAAILIIRTDLFFTADTSTKTAPYKTNRQTAYSKRLKDSDCLRDSHTGYSQSVYSWVK